MLFKFNLIERGLKRKRSPSPDPREVDIKRQKILTNLEDIFRTSKSDSLKLLQTILKIYQSQSRFTDMSDVHRQTLMIM